MSLEIDGGSAREYWTLDSSSYGEVSRQLEQQLQQQEQGWVVGAALFSTSNGC